MKVVFLCMMFGCGIVYNYSKGLCAGVCGVREQKR